MVHFFKELSQCEQVKDPRVEEIENRTTFHTKWQIYELILPFNLHHALCKMRYNFNDFFFSTIMIFLRSISYTIFLLYILTDSSKFHLYFLLYVHIF